MRLSAEFGRGFSEANLRHRGRRKVLGGSHRRTAGAKDGALLGFYADCLHEVRPVRSGYRVALTYQLHHRGASTSTRCWTATACP